MELPRIKKSEHGMLDNIKSKLGFAAPDQGYDGAYYDEGYEEDYGDAADYGDYGEYGPGYDDGPEAGEAPGSRYDPYAPVTTRSAGSARNRSAARGGVGSARLVSIDDVRAHTQVPDSLNRDPLPPRRVTPASPYRGERTMVDASQPTPATMPTARAAAAAGRERSESLNSLFAPTDEGVGSALPPVASVPASSASGQAGMPFSASGSPASAATEAFDPYDAYAGGSRSAKHNPTRSLTVLKPAAYGEVERIAKVLKAGDVVVLALRNTPDNLAKRILDFSFGVSSALDASVEAVADKVFAITRGSGLTDAERQNLRNQGVL